MSFWLPITYLVLSTLAPGPVTVLTIHNASRYGRRAGTAVALGGAATQTLFVLLALFLTRTSVSGLPLHANTFYEHAGALLLLMFGLISGYRVLANPAETARPAHAQRQFNSVFAGMGLMAPFLPQALLFYTVILPEHTSSLPLSQAILWLGGLKILLTLGWYSSLATGASSIQSWFFERHTRRVVDLILAGFLLVSSVALLIN